MSLTNLTAPEFSNDELAELSNDFESWTAEEIIGWGVETFAPHLSITASMTDAVLIDLATKVFPAIEVVFIDTGYHFPETLETVERVRLDEQEYQYLYEEGGMYTFMDQVNFEQVSLSDEMIGDPAVFLQEGMVVTVSSYEGEIVGVSLPDSVIMEVIEADAVVKGQTASSSYKPAKLENGVRVMVPPHIGAGTRIVVNTADSTYVERAKD